MLRPAIEVAALLAGAQAVEPAPIFAPPLDIPLRYRIERVQTEGAAEHRFVAERRVRFSRDGDGYVAEVTLLSVDGGGSGPGAMFEAGMAALIDVPIRHRLSRDGAILSIDDLPSHFATLVDAIAHQGAGRDPKVGRMIATTLRALPPERQRAMIASALRSLLYPDMAGRGPVAEHTIAMTPRPPYSSTSPTTARHGVVASGGDLVATTSGSFAVTAPATTPGVEAETGATMTSEETTTIDAATGLLRSSIDTTVITLSKDRASPRSVTVTTTTLTDPVS